jgi:hypothetical protein
MRPMIIAIALLVVFALGYLTGYVTLGHMKITNPGITGFYIYRSTPTSCEQQVPYQVQETYTETEPYTYYENVPLKYSVKETSASCYKDIGTWAACIDITIENLDDSDGTFSVTIRLDKYNIIKEFVGTSEETQSELIEAGKTHTFSFKIDTKTGESWVYNYDIGVPNKQNQISDYHDVEKTRTVTRYKLENVC